MEPSQRTGSPARPGPAGHTTTTTAIMHAAMPTLTSAAAPPSPTAAAMNFPNNDERSEEHPVFVEGKENSDDNLLDKVAYSEEEAYALYNEYALRSGFSVRKGKPRYHSGTKNVRQREYLCSKEGLKLDEDHCQEKKLHRLETRTGCKAFIRFTVENGVWRVAAFRPQHNHELASPSERHLLRSGRQISKPKAGVAGHTTATIAIMRTAMPTLTSVAAPPSPTAAAVNFSNNAERTEEHLIFVERKENSDDNLLDKVAYSEDEAYALYNEYALRTGFRIRKGKLRYHSGTKNVRQREYLCSKEGLKLDEDPCQEKKLHRLETRTGCTAFIRFTVENGVWRVTAFKPQHNHELASPSERHLLRSGRQISKPKAGVIDSMVNVGIGAKNAYSYLRKEVGGSENVGFTKRDCYNFVNKQKMMMIGADDSQSLLNHFKLKHAKDPMFFYTIQVDQENRMTNFFWRDGRERIDYDCFGDVVVFDTTYRTNKYNLICAPFVGVNHHWQNVMFGCAFLLDETIDSFKWLFKSFLESMGNRPPITIFTDQDQAMSRAIEEVLPNTHHRICLWHVSKNAPSHLGPLNTELEFKYLFNKCQKYCDSEQEFEQTWDKMMQKFNLENHRWLNMMYKIRHKWSTAFTKDSFTAEMKASSRSESTNHVLNGIADKTTTLTKFVVEYDNLVAVMHSVELEEDFRCKQGAPQKAVENSGILDHAAQVYTCKIFKFFQTELLNSLAMNWEKVDCQNTVDVFEVKQENDQRVRTVRFNLLNNNITCSCKKFESLGILCCHALRVFSVKNLTRIPSEYILKRWTKEAKKGMMTYEQNCNSLVNDEDVEIIWRNNMICIANTAISKSQGEDSLKQICQTALLGLGEKIEREFSRLKMGTNVNSNEDQVEQCEITNENHCLPNDMSLLDLPCVRSKGIRNTRLKGHFEKRKTISSKDASSLRKSKQVRQEPSHVSFDTSPY